MKEIEKATYQISSFVMKLIDVSNDATISDTKMAEEMNMIADTIDGELQYIRELSRKVKDD